MAKKRYKLTLTFQFDADNIVLAKAIAAQGKAIVVGEFSKHRDRSEVASMIQELRPDVSWDGPEEVLR